MPKHLHRLTTINPAEILGNAYITLEDAPADYDLLYDLSDEHSLLHWNIAEAIIALLPENLLVRIQKSSDPNWFWELEVCMAVTQSTSNIREVREKELHAQLAEGFDERRWLLDNHQIAERINLDALTREATRRARLVVDSGI